MTLSRDERVKEISAALADGKDSGGFDTLFAMYAHIALSVIERRVEPKPIGAELFRASAAKELRDIMQEMRDWLYGAYYNADSLTAQKVKAALPNIDRHIAALAAFGSQEDNFGENK